MFEGHAKPAEKAATVVEKLSDYGQNRTHERHIHFDECVEFGLNVRLIEEEQPLQDLVLTVQHCFMHSLQNTGSIKMIENHLGAAFVKQVRS